ncbi:MAG: hypothetical protein U1A23_04480 [Candidatus Sungbacteria bacterium]|nr:hypothetical protein [bacterium]MDZ4286162.1 hypothetical protein [Candidatus Sungbacteria bacterium]
MGKQPKQPIEQLILQTLQKGTVSTIKLIESISAIRFKTTKQGIYRVLRKLKDEEKIVIHGKSVSLNLHWIKNMNEFFSLAQFYYSPKVASSDGFLNVREKDKIVYFFKSLNLLDSFWSHAFHIFNEISNPKEPIFVYNPHEWFAYARQETEQTLIKTMKEKNRQVLITVAHNEPLDKELKKKFGNDLLQYDIADKKIFEKQNYYLNIFDDCLIEVFIDQKIAKQIDDFFKKTNIFDDKAREELFEIVSKNGRNKLVISRNRKKAEKYKKTLSKNFYIKR